VSWFQLFLTQDAKSYRKGEIIFERGQPAECMYVVADGEVEISLEGRSMDVLGREGIFGEMALITNEPRSATATARSDCRLVEIPEKHFLYLVAETPHFALEVMRVLAHRLRRRDPIL
jgi:CRP/FNR family cyclic AMP-dependent transcriptional regulator